MTDTESRALTVVDRAERNVQLQVLDPIQILDTARFEMMQRIATVMARSSLVPETLTHFYEKKGNSNEKVAVAMPLETAIANCFQVVNLAVRVNMDPFAVAQCCSIVHGKLMQEGKLVAAIIDQKLGIQLDYEFNGQNGDNFGIVVTGPPSPTGKPRVITGTVGDWKTPGSNSPWTKKSQQESMLAYRGAREWARRYAPAAMLGVITPDEMDDLADAPRSSKPRATVPAGPAIERAQPVAQIADKSGEAKPAETPITIDGAKVLAEAGKVENAKEVVEVKAEPEPETEKEIETRLAKAAGIETDDGEEEISPEQFMADLDEKLGQTKTLDDLHSAYSDFDAEAEMTLVTGGVEKVREIKAKHVARLSPADDPKPDEQPTVETKVEETLRVVAHDPLEIPEEGMIETWQEWETTLNAGIAAVKDEPTADRLTALWKAISPLSESLVVPPPVHRDVKAKVSRVTKAYKPTAATKPAAEKTAEKATEPATVEGGPPATATAYEALYMADVAKAEDFDTAKAIHKRYLSTTESDMRKALALTGEQLTRIKAAMAARIDHFRVA